MARQNVPEKRYFCGVPAPINHAIRRLKEGRD
jgi:hypothetical protein